MLDVIDHDFLVSLDAQPNLLEVSICMVLYVVKCRT